MMKKRTGLCFLVVVVVLAALGLAVHSNSNRHATGLENTILSDRASLSISASPPGTTSYKVDENDRYVVIYPRVVGNASWNDNVSGSGSVTITTTVDVDEGQYHVEGSATTTKTVSNGEDFAVDYQVGLSVLGARLGRWFDVTIDAHLLAPNGASADAHTQYQIYLYW